mgnify:CR=1 FL=1
MLKFSPILSITINQNDVTEQQRSLINFMVENNEKYTECDYLYIVNWTGARNAWKNEKLNLEFNIRFDFLRNNWNDKKFHFFEDFRSSKENLIMNPYEMFRIRGSSIPGSITISFRSEQNIKHCRLHLDYDGLISFKYKNNQNLKFKLVKDLNEWFNNNCLNLESTSPLT